MEKHLSQIIDTLSKKGVDGWQIRRVHKKSYQSFLAKEDTECTRTVDATYFVISIHKKRSGSPKIAASEAGNSASHEILGLTSFKIGLKDLEGLESRIDDARFAADLVCNEPFELPEQPAQLPKVYIYDPALSEKTLTHLEDRIRSAVSKEKNTRLSSAEFFIDTVETALLNHKGLNVFQEETLLHTEFILLSKTQEKENEYINRYTRRFLSDFQLEEELAQSARVAREATVATLPKTGAFPVLLSGEPLDHLFNPLIAKASARLKYNRMIETSIGNCVVEGENWRGDSLTLWMNNLIPKAVGSSQFDSYGIPGQRICLIENNKVKNFLADKRYADYLRLPVTGELGNIEVAPGSTPLEQLKDFRKFGPVIYQLVAFSAFEPNPITGAFSAEIRAGYEITQAGVRPIKGGSVSGVLQRDLLECFFSKETTQREHIRCPEGVLFKNLTLSGN